MLKSIKILPNIAITTSSFNISIEPRAMKYSDVNTSPLCTNVSPGGACVVLNFNDKALWNKILAKCLTFERLRKLYICWMRIKTLDNLD